MNKPEPLKDKICKGQFHKKTPIGNLVGECNGFASDIDIKSAVEWFKREITEQKLFQEKLIYHLIDKAFEDVIER